MKYEYVLIEEKKKVLMQNIKNNTELKKNKPGWYLFIKLYKKKLKSLKLKLKILKEQLSKQKFLISIK